jgi:hypothetical protein
MLSDVLFRVYERQNRAALGQVVRSAGGKEELGGCNADTELGLTIPGLKDPTSVAVKASGASVTLECDGSVVGSFEPGSGDTPPPALWPVLARDMTLHPALHGEIAKTGRAPQHVKASFMLANARMERSWRLVAAESISAPYPLAPSLVDATPGWINETVAHGLGDLAAEAVAGRARGGPPTLASLEVEVARLAKEKGPAAAAFAIWPALNMFPQIAQACRSGEKSAICEAMRGLMKTALTEGAVRALLDVTRAEQLRRPVDAVAAVLGARPSPLAEHPALGASFALALQSGGHSVAQQAKAAGLPSDAKALHVRALQAYPYNPAYWTDLGDYFARTYDLWTAYLLYDVALSLPMPDAQRGNAALAAKRSLAERIQGDFPAFFLPK